MQNTQTLSEWLLRELYFAYIDARKRKRDTNDEHNFELNDIENLSLLCDDIISRRYSPSRGIAFIIHEPVVREIFAAPFRDRIIHHFLYNQVADWWDRRFIYDSYSCRKGKGTLFGIKRLQQHVRKVTKGNSVEAFVLKFDIQGYFMSLSRKKVFERVEWGLNNQFNDNDWLKFLLKFLWRKIILDDPTEGVRIRGKIQNWDDLPDTKSLFCQPPGKGIVIGNLTSQLISNIYLDQLDRYIMYELGYRHYGRYVDDFFIIVSKTELNKALSDVEKINDFLHFLELTMHPKKRYIQNVKNGIPFLGAVVYPDSIVPGKRFKDHFYKAMQKYCMEIVDENTIVSYLGYLKNLDGKKFCKKTFDKFGFDYKY